MDPNDARLGNDLFESLWTTIASILDRISKALTRDEQSRLLHPERHRNHHDTNIFQVVQLHYRFLCYVVKGRQSPLLPSLQKLKLDSARWIHILTWPFVGPPASAAYFAKEARDLASQLAKLAGIEARRDFDDLLVEILDTGDGWAHKWIKDEKPIPNLIVSPILIQHLPRGITHMQAKSFIDQHFGEVQIIQTSSSSQVAIVHFCSSISRAKALNSDGHPFAGHTTKLKIIGRADKYTSDPVEVVEAHSDTWANHWRTHNIEKAELVAHTIAKAIEDCRLMQPTTTTPITPDDIRTAATSFKKKTAIGTDHWKFLELVRMPDVALATLAEHLTEVRDTSTAPLQMLSNLMATLAKKDGGTRTVAIAAIVYRLLMQIDNV